MSIWARHVQEQTKQAAMSWRYEETENMFVAFALTDFSL